MLSPDNTRLAVSRTRDIWIVELARGVSHRLTFDAARDRSPAWFPDSSRIAFMSDRDGMQGIYQVAASQPGQEQLLLKTTLALAPTALSRDGRFLLAYTTFGVAAPNDIWLISLGDSPSARRALPLVQAPFNERGARLSPDGRFFSYTSNETGQDEAYVRPFDGDSPSVNSGQVLVSKNGGTSPKWRGDGKELFYQLLDGTIVSVDVTTTPEFRVRSNPKPLFKPPMRATYWDVTSDGQRFMIPVSTSESIGEPYKVILNWTATLRKRSPPPASPR